MMLAEDGDAEQVGPPQKYKRTGVYEDRDRE